MHKHAGRMVVAVALVALGGCSSAADGGDDHPADPQARLDAAGDILDRTQGVRFNVQGDGLPSEGTVVVSAEGVAVPPASFDGDVRITTAGLAATLGVISVGGELWARLPFANDFARVDAGSLGFGDPGALIDPDQGVSLLLKSGSQVTAGDQVRVDGQVLDQVESVLPGSLVGDVLTIADPAADVHALWSLDPGSGELRRAVLTGPFYPSGGEQTYTVRLTDYDEPVEISAPSS
ncbi:MAG: LppX_LprAFG lipoprotein [Jiangellaceae bacterium]